MGFQQLISEANANSKFSFNFKNIRVYLITVRREVGLGDPLSFTSPPLIHSGMTF